MQTCPLSFASLLGVNPNNPLAKFLSLMYGQLTVESGGIGRQLRIYMSTVASVQYTVSKSADAYGFFRHRLIVAVTAFVLQVAIHMPGCNRRIRRTGDQLTILLQPGFLLISIKGHKSCGSKMLCVS